MNYLVCAERTAYHLWQLELLIESFKLLDLQDSLTIAIAENKEPVFCPYNRNFNSHKKTFAHNNAGNCNRVYALALALQNNMVKFPVTILHPDMILVKPITTRTYDFAFQLDQSFKQIEDADLSTLITKICETKKLELTWLNLGGTFCINNLPQGFIERVVTVANYWKSHGKTWHVEKAAWLTTLLEHVGHLSYHGTFDLECQLVDKELKSVIHYKHGLPPMFTKQMFKFEWPNIFNMGDPYQILLENNPNKVTDYVQKVVKTYKEQDKNITKSDSAL